MICSRRASRARITHLAGKIVGQHVETIVTVLGGLTRCLGTTLVATGLGRAPRVLDGMTLFIDDVVERVGDLLEDAAEIAPIEALLTLFAQPVHDLAHALQTVAVAVLETLLHHPTQGAVHVAVIEQIVGHRVEHGFRIELETLLRAIPS